MTPRMFTLDVPYVTHPEATHQMTYYEWGDAENPQVVFCVHGLSRNGRDFDYLANALADHYRIISVDMPGRGRSEWLADKAEYNVGSYSANLIYLMNHLELPPVYWIGTSMGGILGMMIGGAEPQRLHALTLNDVGAWIPAAALRRLSSYVGVLTEFPGYAAAEQALRKSYAPFGIQDERQWRHLFAHSLEDGPEGGVRVTYDPAIGAALQDPERIQDIDLWKFWHAIRCPVLLLRGAESDVLPREIALRMLASRPGVSYHSFPGVGHAPALMADDQLTVVQSWLSRLQPQQTAA